MPRHLALFILISAALGGCVDDDEIDGTADTGGPDAAPGCVEGEAEPCEVIDGCDGVRRCVDGVFGACVAPPERCDGADDDCDGVVDEGYAGLGEACSAGEGACAADGVRVCAADGEGVLCDAEAGAPADEACNGLDDDCDGTADEGLGGGMPCETGEPGVCAPGTTACRDGDPICVPDAEPSAELCDGLDNDCDGGVDEGEDGAPLSRRCYEGPEGTVDVGRCGGGVQTCGGGVFGACVGQVLPGDELCDGVDNDCDGEVDDVEGGCACMPGEARDCYSGPDGTAGVGACRAGRQTCLPDGSTFGPCEGEVVPAAEVCATRAQDLDCDGDTDDVPGTGEACAVGVGACRAEGVTACGADDRVACAAEAGAPGAEVCDGIDNDCDGAVDDVDGLGDACQAGVGACLAEGVRVCDLEAGALACDAVAGEPGAEVCDGIDNDCNGQVDDVSGVGEACEVGVGACAAEGTRVCDLGAGLVVCDAVAAPPGDEVCDGIDNDCDGTVDDVPGLGDACQAGVGACAANGSQVCDLGARRLVCDAVAGQPGDEVCDGIDNDCDGTVDDVPGVGAPCAAGEGECRRDGAQVCGAGGLVCGAQPGPPGDEVCDGLDNDCDGIVDDVPGLGAACIAGRGICRRDGVQVCGPDGLACDAQPGPPGVESCDDRDEDCDGRTDEALTRGCYPGPGGTQDVGTCRGGTQTCNAGAFGACEGAVTPVDEFCDGEDRDCNGEVDDIRPEFQATPFAANAQCWQFAVGDLDRNGRLDVACTLNVDDGRIAYWRDDGLGDFRAVQYSGALPGRLDRIAMADLDGDGDPDVVVTGQRIRPHVFLNDNGALRVQGEAFGYAAGGGPSSQGLVLTDYTGDGRVDIIASIGTAGGNNWRIAMAAGNGNGTFAAPVESGQGVELYDLSIGDIDQDGDRDLIGHGGGTAGILRANAGRFDRYVELFAFRNFPSQHAFADFTGDGRPDFVLGTEAEWILARAEGNGFAAPIRTVDRGTLMAATAGELDCDPLPELVMTRSNPASPIVIALDPANQSGIFETFSAHGWGLEARDMTGDQLDDLLLPRAEGGFTLMRQLP